VAGEIVGRFRTRRIFTSCYVDDFRKAGGDGLEFLFQCGVGDFLPHPPRMVGGLAFDVGEDGERLRELQARISDSELGYAVMSFFEFEVLVEFEVLLDVQFAFEILLR